MHSINTDDVVFAVEIMAFTAINNEEYFCLLDSRIGDGDFGTSLAKGFKYLRKEWHQLSRQSIGSFLKSCGSIILEQCGGASGPIWGSAFLAAGKLTKDKTTMEITELPKLLQCVVKAIQTRGGAALGDKTLLDALISAALALEAGVAANENPEQAAETMVLAAKTGANNTATISASKGRASYLGERSLGQPDPGAVAVSIILEEIVRAFHAKALHRGAQR